MSTWSLTCLFAVPLTCPGALPRELCRSQWAGSSHTDMPTDQPGSDESLSWCALPRWFWVVSSWQINQDSLHPFHSFSPLEFDNSRDLREVGLHIICVLVTDLFHSASVLKVYWWCYVLWFKHELFPTGLPIWIHSPHLVALFGGSYRNWRRTEPCWREWLTWGKVLGASAYLSFHTVYIEMYQDTLQTRMAVDGSHLTVTDCGIWGSEIGEFGKFSNPEVGLDILPCTAQPIGNSAGWRTSSPDG